jgi:hypothetical protein
MKLGRLTKARLASIATVGLLAGFGPVVAAAAPATTAPSGWARFGHFAPTADPVDVTVDGMPFAQGIGFKLVSDYLPLPAGDHHFELRLSSEPGGPVVLAIDAAVPTDASVTVAAVSTEGGVAGHVFDDELTQPPTGQALVRFIDANPTVPAFDVQVAGGPTVAAGVQYPSATGYVPITPGMYDVDVVSPGTADVLLRISGWSIAAGVQSSVIIIEGLDGKLDVAPVLDSIAVSAPPSGGIQTGYGGMAPQPGNSFARSLVEASLAVAAVATVILFACGIAKRRKISASSR